MLTLVHINTLTYTHTYTSHVLLWYTARNTHTFPHKPDSNQKHIHIHIQVGYVYLDLAKIPFNRSIDEWQPIYLVKTMRMRPCKPRLHLQIYKSRTFQTAVLAAPATLTCAEVTSSILEVSTLEATSLPSDNVPTDSEFKEEPRVFVPAMAPIPRLPVGVVPGVFAPQGYTQLNERSSSAEETSATMVFAAAVRCSG